MPRKPVAQYLREIPMSLSGIQQSYPEDWSEENNMLVWHNKREGSYVFAEHQRPMFFRSPDSYYWKAYDWYERAASIINKSFLDEEEAYQIINRTNGFSLENLPKNLDSRSIYKEKVPIFEVPDEKLTWPSTIRNTSGIHRYLIARYAPASNYLTAYNQRAINYNKQLELIAERKANEEYTKIKNEQRAIEETKHFGILTELGGLKKQISELDYKVGKINTDRDKEFTLFKSELTSQIPAKDMNVSRIEHDEDVARLNDTIAQLQKQVGLSRIDQGVSIERQNKTFQENNRKTENRIKNLNKTFQEQSDKLREKIERVDETLSAVKSYAYATSDRVNINDQSIRNTNERINAQNRSIQNTNERINAQNRSIQNTNERIDAQNRSIQNTNERIDWQGQELRFKGEEIRLLRKNLQDLGKKTKTFINNEKRQKQTSTPKVAKKESVVARAVRKAAFPDLTKRPWLKQSVTGRFFQLANQW